MPVWAMRRDGLPTGPSVPPHAVLAPFLRWLGPQDRAQLVRFRRLEDAQRGLLGRLLPRFLLATEFDVPWETVEIQRTTSGRPFLVNSTLELDFNISHDSDWVALGWMRGKGRIGIDVMRLKVPWDGESVDGFIEGLHEQLTPRELSGIMDEELSSDRLRRTLVLWTVKEAYTKALGVGLGFDFTRVEVTFTPLHVVDTVSVDGAVLSGWRFDLLELEDHLVAVATEGDELSTLRLVDLAEIAAVVPK